MGASPHPVNLNRFSCYISHQLTATVSNLTAVDLTSSFTIPGTIDLVALGPQTFVPPVSQGTLWSDGISRMWLYGGNTSNALIHRFDTATLEWAAIESKKSTTSRKSPMGGAGVNVPSISTGFYLGGYDGSQTDVVYSHTMTIFDMTKETISVVDVPAFVPIVGQSMVFLETASKGLLAVLGGKTERNGTVAYVSSGSVTLILSPLIYYSTGESS